MNIDDSERDQLERDLKELWRNFRVTAKPVQDDEAFRDRVAEVAREELAIPEHWMYLSFADDEFKGGVIIKAHGITDATMKCSLLQINPGGQVAAYDLIGEVADMLPEEKYRNRLLTREDILEFWPDAKSIREFEEEEK